MNSLVSVLEKYDKFASLIKDVKQGVNPIMLSGLTDGGKVPFFCCANVCRKSGLYCYI